MNMIYDIIKNSYDRNINIAVFFKPFNSQAP